MPKARADGDLDLTVRARHCLAQDGELGPLNLGVTARAGTVTVWGTVPTPEAGQRALDLLRRLPGVQAIRNELAPLAPERPVSPPPPRRKRPRLESVVRDGDGKPAPVPAVRIDRPIPPPRRSPPAVSLLAPEPLPPRAPETAPDLSTAVEQVHRSDARFRPVRVEVRGRVVVLRAAPTARAEVMAFARRVTHLPGVERVVVEPE